MSSELPPRPGQLGGRVPPRARDQEYTAALADAQRAAERLREVEERLARGAREFDPVRPVGARATVSRSDAGTLLVSIPPAGLNAGSLVGGAFSVAWFSMVGPATASMVATGGVSALFMLPFWAAGGAVAKQTIYDPAKATEMSIGEFAWECATAWAELRTRVPRLIRARGSGLARRLPALHRG